MRIRRLLCVSGGLAASMLVPIDSHAQSASGVPQPSEPKPSEKSARPTPTQKGPRAMAKDLLWPKFVPAPREEPPPSGKTLILIGAVAFGVPYAGGASAAAFTGFANRSSWMLVPVWGPVATAMKRESGCSSEEKGETRCPDTVLSIALIVDAVVQFGGVGAMLTGAIVSVAPETAPWLLGDVRVGPGRVGSGSGLVFEGRL